MFVLILNSQGQLNRMPISGSSLKGTSFMVARKLGAIISI